MRLNKFLAQSGVASRRGAEKLIEEGRVFVNGEIITEQGVKVDPQEDLVEVDGRAVGRIEEKVYIALNKPKGYVTTRADFKGEKTIYDLLPREYRKILHPIGRLDKDSEGLLLLTNDGELTYKLTHPKFEHQKEYEVHVSGSLPKQKIDLLEAGVEIDGKKTAPAKISLLFQEGGLSVLSVVVHEGRKRQVRRMFQKTGNSVKRLVRVREAGIDLRKSNIKKGEFKVIKKPQL